MSVTALRRPPPRPPGPTAPAPTRPSAEPRLTVRVEVTLDGDSRHRDAAEILDALQRITDRLGRVGSS